MLTGWLGGPAAKTLQNISMEDLEAKAFAALSRFFNIDVLHLHQLLIGMYFHNWSADPYFRGAYSYEVVGGTESIQILQQPVEGTLFFAGEGLHHGPEIGTVEGALQSGREASHRLIMSF
jgi:monoamine oxidase